MSLLVLAAGLAACGGADGPTHPTAADSTGTITVAVDSLPAGTVVGVRVFPPDGIMRYTQVTNGTTAIIPFGGVHGTYRVAFDTVTLKTNPELRESWSLWATDPGSVSFQLTRDAPAFVARATFRQITGGITATETGSPVMLWEVLNADGTGCRCTSTGNGRRDGTTGIIAGLLPGEYQVHFIPVFLTNGSPHDPGPFPTVVPSPDLVRVTVRARELTSVSTVYK